MLRNSDRFETLRPEFWPDFYATIFAIPNTSLEIAFASKGGSVFNTAVYYESLPLDKLESYARTDCNVALLSACNSKYLLVPKGEKTKRLATNQCIRHKNVIVFDLDFKDNIPNYTILDKKSRKNEVLEFVDIIKSKIASEQIPLWILNFSGNGLHFYFKLTNPIETHNAYDYKTNYQSICHYLGGVLGAEFDQACSNTARLIRMPGSTNWKDIADPTPCEILFFAKENFADDFINKFTKKVELAKPRNFQGKQEILSRLDLLKILRFFEYQKIDSITETKDKIVCSSPLSSDHSPSFHYDKSTQLFYDFSSAKGGDLFQLIALQAGLEIKQDFRKVLQYAKKIAGILESERSDTPGRYELKDEGVWFLSSGEEKDSKYWVSSYLDVIALSRNLQGQGWGRILLIRDSEGNEKTWPMPMEMLAGDGLELRKKLLDLGVQLNPSKTARNYLIHYISEKNPKRFFRAIEHLGWVGHSFVFPEKICKKESDDGVNIVLADSTHFAKFLPSGSLEVWIKEVSSYAKGNPLLQLALATAFAPPLLNLCGDENFGIHLVGPSSIGKTITLDVAGSVWGGGGVKGYKTRWRSTLNGLEALAYRHNDTLLVLDELAEVAPKSAASAAYMLANGAGKVRGSKDGGLQDQVEWRSIFLSAGEIDLSTHLESDGQKSRAGQEVRMLSLEADRDKGFGCFDHLHEFGSSSVFAEHLRFASQRNYGIAIRDFIEKLLKIPDLFSTIKAAKEAFKNRLKFEAYHGQILRVLDRFAILYAAGSLAIKFGLLPVEESELSDSLSEMLKVWVANNGNDQLEEYQILSTLRHYLQAYGLTRFPELNGKEPVLTSGQCSGFRKQSKDGSYDWFILTEIFKKEIFAGLNLKVALKALEARNCLNLDPSGRKNHLIRVPGLGANRFYMINSSLL